DALIDLTSWYDGAIDLVTRRYPVDLSSMSQKLRSDLQGEYDFAIHLGQAPGQPVIKLESVALNVRSDGSELIAGAPPAYRCGVNLAPMMEALTESGIPTQISHHAGTYLCNAALYLSQHYSASFGMGTKSTFIHLPLTPAQVARSGDSLPSMSTPMASAAVAITIASLTGQTVGRMA
ncbi:MAG: pyroglutamyl-peptidase I, partial [Planctomycetota bacterium]